MMNQWNKRTAKPGECLHFRIGQLSVWLVKKTNEWQITSKDEDHISAKGPIFKQLKQPQMGNWQHWITGDNSSEFQLKPTLPDRSIVAKSEYTLQIPPGVEITLFIGIPLWISIEVGTKMKSRIFAQPSIRLSNTWFGEMETGELCYALKSSVRHTHTELETAFHKVFCPINIHNNSDESLDFQQFLLPSRHLTIYSGEKHLWTNTIKVEFKGSDKGENFSVLKSLPSFESNLKLLTKADEPFDKNVVKQTFASLRSITDF